MFGFCVPLLGQDDFIHTLGRKALRYTLSVLEAGSDDALDAVKFAALLLATSPSLAQSEQKPLTQDLVAVITSQCKASVCCLLLRNYFRQ